MAKFPNVTEEVFNLYLNNPGGFLELFQEACNKGICIMGGNCINCPKFYSDDDPCPTGDTVLYK